MRDFQFINGNLSCGCFPFGGRCCHDGIDQPARTVELFRFPRGKGKRAGIVVQYFRIAAECQQQFSVCYSYREIIFQMKFMTDIKPFDFFSLGKDCETSAMRRSFRGNQTRKNMNFIASVRKINPERMIFGSFRIQIRIGKRRDRFGLKTFCIRRIFPDELLQRTFSDSCGIQPARTVFRVINLEKRTVIRRNGICGESIFMRIDRFFEFSDHRQPFLMKFPQCGSILLFMQDCLFLRIQSHDPVPIIVAQTVSLEPCANAVRLAPLTSEIDAALVSPEILNQFQRDCGSQVPAVRFQLDTNPEILFRQFFGMIASRHFRNISFFYKIDFPRTVDSQMNPLFFHIFFP